MENKRKEVLQRIVVADYMARSKMALGAHTAPMIDCARNPE